MSVDKLLFVHVPKTAGTTARTILADSLSPANVSPPFNAKRLDAADARRLANYRVISGHISWEDVMTYFPDRRLFTFLRDPIDRCLSIYWFFREQTDRPLIPLREIRGRNDADEATSLARQLEPEDFFESRHPHVRQNVENRMVWQLGHRANIEDRAAKSPSEVLDRAFANLRRFSFVGYYENFAADLRRLLDSLHLPPVDAVPVVNPTVARPRTLKLSERLRNILDELTVLDRQLYERATRELKIRAGDGG